MKFTQLLPVAMGLFPAFSNAQANWGWSIENVPEGGLKDISFPLAATGSNHTKHYYYAMQYPFIGHEDIGYTGLQPQEDKEDGTVQIRGVFSTFISGSTTDDKLCSEGADGGPGISCGLIFPGSYDHTYNMVIKNTAGTTWTGTAVDSVNGDKYHLGTYTLPTGSGGIEGGHMGFVEDYVGVDSCSESPVGGVVVGVPFSDSVKNTSGVIKEPSESGTCVGSAVNWAAKQNADDTWSLSLGFE